MANKDPELLRQLASEHRRAANNKATQAQSLLDQAEKYRKRAQQAEQEADELENQPCNA